MKTFEVTDSSGDEYQIEADYARINGTTVAFYNGTATDVGNNLVAGFNNYVSFMEAEEDEE